MLRIPLSPLLAIVLLLAAGAPPAGATWSAQDNAIPGAAASAGFKGKLYIFARNADNSLRYRTADGRIYSDWTPLDGFSQNYPAAATATDGSFLALFHRGMDNALYVSRTFNGTSYEPWSYVGGVALSAAPSAVGFNGRIHVFVRDIYNVLYTRSSSDAVTWSNWIPLGGQLSAAPVATVMRRADGQSQIVVIVRNAADSKLYQRTSTDGSNFTPWFKRSETTLAINPNDQADFPIVTDLGFNFISPGYPDGSWESYKLPVFSTAQAQLAKFNLFFDGDDTTFPAPVFSASHIQDVIDRGAITIILRFAETKISADEVEKQLRVNLRASNQSVLDLIAANPYRQFWIEVGNEPNIRCKNPYDVRWHLLNTIKEVASDYRTSHPNMRWMASLPTRHGYTIETTPPPSEERCKPPLPDGHWPGLNYLDIVLSDTGDGFGTILAGPNQYEAVGIHMFGNEMLQQGFPRDTLNGTSCSGDSDCPTVVLDRVLAMTAKTIFITEAGMNRDWDWYFVDADRPGKATYHIRAMAATRPGARLRGMGGRPRPQPVQSRHRSQRQRSRRGILLFRRYLPGRVLLHPRPGSARLPALQRTLGSPRRSAR